MILDNDLQLADGSVGTSNAYYFVKAAAGKSNLGPALDIGTPRDLGNEMVSIQIDASVTIPTTAPANAATYTINLVSGNKAVAGNILTATTNQTFCVGTFTLAEVNSGINEKLSNVPFISGVIDSGKYLKYCQLQVDQSIAVAAGADNVNIGGTLDASLTIAKGTTEHVYYPASDLPSGNAPAYFRPA